MPTGTMIVPLDVLFNCLSPCLMFLRFPVCCAAYAAWTRPRLAKTDKSCVKLTCLYQVLVFSRSNKQVLSAGLGKLARAFGLHLASQLGFD